MEGGFPTKPAKRIGLGWLVGWLFHEIDIHYGENSSFNNSSVYSFTNKAKNVSAPIVSL